MSTQELSMSHLQRELRLLRETVIAAIETAKKLLENHREQLENINTRLERLEREVAGE